MFALGDGGGDSQVNHPDKHDRGKLLHPGEGMFQDIPADYLKHQHYSQDKKTDGSNIELYIVEKGLKVKFPILHGKNLLKKCAKGPPAGGRVF